MPPAAPQDLASSTLLALIQGLTEFLPVSSSGHLVLARAALGSEGPGLALDIALHLGTLLAVVGVYRGSLFSIARDLRAGRPRELLLLAVGSLPAGVVGVALKEPIRGAFEEPRGAAAGLFVTAALLLLGERARRSRAGGSAALAESSAEPPGGRHIGVRDALWIGAAQALAIWPGISRSGATIAAGLVRGVPAAEAARFSFLLSIPAILGAAALGLPEAAREGTDLGALLWPAALAGIVGYGALRALLGFLGRGAFAGFALYCALLGGGFLVLSR